MTQNYKQACILGGTGFIGTQITRELVKLGYIVRVATRTPEKAYFLKTCGSVGQVVPVFCDYADDATLEKAIKGCNVVINCIGILYEKRNGDFAKTHTELPRRIAKVCKTLLVERLIHISALGCDSALSLYGRSKMAGEQAILENFHSATILRPSVVFGAGDNFFNMFAKLSVVLPFLPLIGGGKTKFQPVYVGDIVDAVCACLKSKDTMGKIYELGGPEILTFKEIYQKLFSQTGRKKMLVTLPWGIAKIQGTLMGMLPSPILTADQVLSLKTDTIVGSNSLTFKELGLVPTSMDTILPSYLFRYKPGGRFGDKKRT